MTKNIIVWELTILATHFLKIPMDVPLKGHGPPEDEVVKRKVRVSFILKSLVVW
jgi:hypothetical protein